MEYPRKYDMIYFRVRDIPLVSPNYKVVALDEIRPTPPSNSDLVKPNIFYNSDFRFRTFFSPDHEVPPQWEWRGLPSEANAILNFFFPPPAVLLP